MPYKSMLIRELADRLGGSWDLTRTESPIGQYWSDLYELRNRIIHAGYEPHDGDAERAERAYVAFDQFIEERLHANWTTFSRTLLAKVGRQDLVDRGWATRRMREFFAQVDAEEFPYFLPKDIASR